MFVSHPQRCPYVKTRLGQHANASRLTPVGWSDVQLMIHLLAFQVKLEFSAD